jgi:hypothetical protein
MIIGAHAIVYSKDPDADRAFLRDVIGFRGVDVGGGWTIFGLPPAEVAVHPSEENGVHELYLMCDDVEAFIAGMIARGVPCGPVQEPRWGRLTEVTLPGGGKLGVYEPRHARPPAVEKQARKKPAAKKKPAARKKPAAKRVARKKRL